MCPDMKSGTTIVEITYPLHGLVGSVLAKTALVTENPLKSFKDLRDNFYTNFNKHFDEIESELSCLIKQEKKG